MRFFITVVLLLTPARAMATLVDMSLSDEAAIYAAKNAGYKGTAKALAVVGKELEANILARLIMGECRVNDLQCATEAVGVTVMSRAWAASTPDIHILPSEVIKTPSQYPGYWGNLSKKNIEKKMKWALPMARWIINGGLNNRFEPGTHYAQERALLKTKWGRMARAAGAKMKRLGDNHIVISELMPFKLPPRAKRGGSWCKCKNANPRLMSFYSLENKEKMLFASN